MTQVWSEQIANRYGCRLSAELADWFDSQMWQYQGRAEFCQSVSPQESIEGAPDQIWPGMMGSDCLPILSNKIGDWLCVRIDANNQASQIIHWFHGGGDWIPWGNHLAEAIAFDAVADRYPSHDRQHAVSAQGTRVKQSPQEKANDPFLRWACDHLPDAVMHAIQSPVDCQETAIAFLDHQIAEVATRCELSVSAVMNADPASAPHDWASAAVHAEPVTNLAPELAWAWETIGYAAEYRDQTETAVDAYTRAAQCSAFTDQSVRLTTHRIAGQTAKFSAARLLSLRLDLVEQSTYLRLLCNENEQERRRQVSDHWLTIGEAQQQSDDPASAYASFVLAGWDIGMTPIESFAKLLEMISEAAELSGQSARAAVARTHRQCLVTRYGE